MNEWVALVRSAVVDMRRDEIEERVRNALESGASPELIMKEGLIEAMDIVGKRFGAGEIFVPEMLVSAMVMKMGLSVIKSRFTGEMSAKGTVIMGTVKGDLHDIGKNIVVMLLEGAGYTVVDLGVDLSPEKIADAVSEIKPVAVGLSALLTTTMPEIKTVIDVLKKRGLRDQVKIMVGGAPVNQKFADQIGADAYGKDAAAAVQLVRSFTA